MGDAPLLDDVGAAERGLQAMAIGEATADVQQRPATELNIVGRILGKLRLLSNPSFLTSTAARRGRRRLVLIVTCLLFLALDAELFDPDDSSGDAQTLLDLTCVVILVGSACLSLHWILIDCVVGILCGITGVLRLAVLPLDIGVQCMLVIAMMALGHTGGIHCLALTLAYIIVVSSVGWHSWGDVLFVAGITAPYLVALIVDDMDVAQLVRDHEHYNEILARARSDPVGGAVARVGFPSDPSANVSSGPVARQRSQATTGSSSVSFNLSASSAVSTSSAPVDAALVRIDEQSGKDFESSAASTSSVPAADASLALVRIDEQSGKAPADASAAPCSAPAASSGAPAASSGTTAAPKQPRPPRAPGWARTEQQDGGAAAAAPPGFDARELQADEVGLAAARLGDDFAEAAAQLPEREAAFLATTLQHWRDGVPVRARRRRRLPLRIGSAKLPLALPDFEETPLEVVEFLLVQALSGMNPRGQGCCTWHVVVLHCYRHISQLLHSSCKEDWAPYSDFQCYHCGAMNARDKRRVPDEDSDDGGDEDDVCAFCNEVQAGEGEEPPRGQFQDLIGDAESAEDEVPQASRATAGARPCAQAPPAATEAHEQAQALGTAAAAADAARQAQMPRAAADEPPRAEVPRARAKAKRQDGAVQQAPAPRAAADEPPRAEVPRSRAEAKRQAEPPLAAAAPAPKEAEQAATEASQQAQVPRAAAHEPPRGEVPGGAADAQRQAELPSAAAEVDAAQQAQVPRAAADVPSQAEVPGAAAGGLQQAEGPLAPTDSQRQP